MVRLVALSLAVLSCFPLSAAEVWDGAPFTADPQTLLFAASAVPPQKPEDAVIVLLDENVVTFDAAGRSKRVERLIYRVIQESAVESWGSIQTSWSPWYHERPEVDARVISRDGAVHRLDPKSFGLTDAQDEPDMFSDTRVLSGPLPAVAPGSVIEQTITYREKNPLYDAGVADRHQFGRWVETRQSRLVLEYPTALPLKLSNRSEPRIEPRREEQDGVTRLTFETGPRPAMEAGEWYLPSDVTNQSYVAWSTGKSWQDVARRYAQIVDEKIGDLSTVAKLTAAAVGNAKDPHEIAKRALAAVERDIRYAGVEFGEGSIFPRTPSETLKNKYGDCKDKATLLVAMLRQAGVPAHTVLIRSGYGYDVEPELPGLGYFNHVIVVTEGPDPIWIDPTDEFARAGELPDSDQGRLVLVAKNDTTGLIRTPESVSSANRTIETREFWLAEDGKARIVEINEYHGSDERSTRRYYTGADQKKVSESLTNYAEQVYLAKTLSKWEKSDPRDLSTPFRLSLEMQEATRGTTAGGEAAVGIFFARMTSDLPADFHRTDEEIEKEEIKPRRNDFVFPKPYVLELHYRIHPPPGYELRTLPAEETQAIGTATLTKKAAVLADGTVTYDLKLDSGPRRITAAQYEELRKAVVKIDDEKPFLLYFDSIGRKHLDAGDVGKAVAEFRRLSGLHPKEALHHSDVARALMAGSLGAAARAEARRAVEIEPQSAKAYLALGQVLANDLIGRRLRTGADIPGAIAAFRKAKSLDPADITARAELAMLLQHSDAGVRYAEPARLDEAIAEYLAMKAEIDEEERDDPAIDRELMTLYAHRGRWDELRKLIAETKDTSGKDAMLLVVTGATAGGPAAVTASQSIELANRRAAQTQAGGILGFLRHYPAAADLINAAAAGAPNASQLRMQAELFRKAVRHEELKIDGTDAPSLLKSAFLDLFTGATEEDLNRKYSTADVIEVLSGERMRSGHRKTTMEGAEVRKSLARKDPQSRLVTDLALSAFKFEMDGDESVGVRLRGRFPSGARETEFAAYLVKENGAFRFAATDDSPSEFALRALRLAEKNELAAARQWLDWAREHVSGGGDDDPATGEPFAALWSRGKEGTAEEIRLAAAVLLPDTKASAQLALTVLEPARASAAPEVQWRIDQGLATAYRILERWTDLLAVADRLGAKFPESEAAFHTAMFALTKLERLDEIRTRAQARLARTPGDTAALQHLGKDALHRRDYAGAVKYFGDVLERANATANDYNEHAWASLFATSDLDLALENAKRAASELPDYAILNTLAAVYAEQGNSTEARETLLKSVEEHASDELEDADWYVVGRIAENYGITDAAADAYRKIPKPETLGGSTWELAQKRLAAIR